MILILTGTPGVGKSTVAKHLAKKINAEVLDLEKIAKKEKIVKGYDRKARSYVINETKLTKAIKKYVTKDENYIIPNHIAQFISPKIVDICVVLRYDPKKLASRLKRRGYHKSKINENVEAEILDTCLIEALQNKQKVHEIDTTGKKVKEIVNEILDIINKKKKPKYGKVKWLPKYENLLK
ncbi:MAG: adenylate kinase family protein [Nanoarchaeota archaeon]|nr:adenylate kinase family protein [Nanoarchaeota archaeon]